MIQKVHVAIVLDRSGSMESCRTDAIGAVNGYLRLVREDKEMDARISLVIFDSQSIDTIRDRVSAGSCPNLDPVEYQPRDATPLLDAVGSGAGLLDRHAEEGERCILAVMTDGLENASKEYTNERLKTLLERKQKDNNWLVVYLGADHDSWAQARAMGIQPTRVASFAKDNIASTGDILYAFSGRLRMSEPRDAVDVGFTDEERAELMKRKDKTKT